jgi:hypothetical protein
MFEEMRRRQFIVAILMREELKARNGLRGEFTATFERYGRATVAGPYHGKREVVTLLFVNVCDASGKQMSDHIWFQSCKQWAVLGLRPGERVKFEARIKPYQKGYGGDERELDYKLSHPTKARLVSAEDIKDLPLFAHADKRV